MKIAEAVTKPQKVRCSGCGLVILVTPDPKNPSNVLVSVPAQASKSQTKSASQQKILLLSILGALGLFLALAIWYTEGGQPERAAAEGEVTYDVGPLEKGTITFTLLHDTKQITATATITKGRYSMRASRGPGIGTNKVEITGDGGAKIHPRYNSATELEVEIQAGHNAVKPFEVKSK